MDDQLNNLLLLLDDEVEKKCFEIRRKRKDKAMKQFFMTACALFLIVPVLFVFMGFNILPFAIPAALFLTVSIIVSVPLLFNTDKEGASQ